MFYLPLSDLEKEIKNCKALKNIHSKAFSTKICILGTQFSHEKKFQNSIFF